MARPPLPLGTWGKITRTQVAPGRWRARARYRDYDGRTRPVERFGASGAKAERALLDALAERDRTSGSVVDITRKTRLADLADLWLAKRVESGDYAVGTLDNDRELITLHITPGLGEIRVGEATVGVLDRFLRAVATDSRSRQCRTVLSGMMTLAAQHDAIERNPIVDTTRRSSETAVTRALTIDELQQLRIRIATWSGTNRFGPKRGVDFPDLADCLIGSGGRISEVLAFRWEHVQWSTDLAPAMVYLDGAINKRGEYQPRPKTATSQHWLILPDFMVAALERQRERDLPSDDLGLVFPSRDGGPRTTANTRRQFRDARRTVVVGADGTPDGPPDLFEWVTPKTFRKTVATILADEVGMEAAAEQLGHTSPEITRRHYVQRKKVTGDVRHVLDRLAPVVSGGFSVGDAKNDPSQNSGEAV
ncbi:site-specific integrase [Gordonia desulfuricans]|uniref:Site-specific integrase n=1 Tax=Gordonia desulfuricans TaxID=89051 RepID=A0A7K3LU04_9ACTN|nr:site-specific integrase [Gordonia desulfuricans]NDK91765.1 site-specific integrase [Gordonia desulfuricans]